MLLQQLVVLIVIFAVHPSAASLSVSATESPQPEPGSAVQTVSATLQPSPSQTSVGPITQSPLFDSTDATSTTTLHLTLSPFISDSRNQIHAATTTVSPTVQSSALFSLTKYIEPSPTALSFRSSTPVAALPGISGIYASATPSLGPVVITLSTALVTPTLSTVGSVLATSVGKSDPTIAPSLGTSSSVVAPSLGTSPVVAPSLGISALVVALSLGTSASVVTPSLGTSASVVTPSLGTSQVMAPSLGTSAPVATPSLGTSAPVVAPSPGTSARVVSPSLGASAPVVAPSLGTSAVTPSLGTSAPVVVAPSIDTSAPVMTQSLAISAPIVAPSLVISASVVAPPHSASSPVVAPSLGTSAPVMTPSLGTSAPVVAPSLGTSAPVVTPSLGILVMTPSLGKSAPVVAPSLGTSAPVITPSPGMSGTVVPTSSLVITTSPSSWITPVIGTPSPVITHSTGTSASTMSSLGTPTPTVTPSLRSSAPLVRPSYSTTAQAPSTTFLDASRSAVSSSLRASATPSTAQLSTVRLDTSQITATMQTGTVLVSPSAVRSVSPVTATVTPTTTGPTSPTRQLPVLQAQSLDVVSRSSEVFSPVEGATMVFNYAIRNAGPGDLPPNSSGNLQLKVYLTNSAQFDAATIVSRPIDATVRPLHTALIRQGIKSGKTVELFDLSAQVSVPQANCSSFTHLCVAFDIHGTGVNQTGTGVCKPLGSEQGGVGTLDCSKALGACSVACDANANCIQADDGKANCVCATGYTGDGTVCWDEDECRSAPCADVRNSRCVNTVGSYHCACVPGYVRTGGTCRAVAAFQADVRFFAFNFTDAYSDSSSAEFRQLADIYSNEMTSLYLASPLASVFRSVQVLGFRKGSVIGTHAVNVAAGSGETASSVSRALQNTIQSAGGTALQMSTAVEVTDYDECASPDRNDCSSDARCENRVGGFTCLCRTGYQDRSPQGRPGRKCYNSTLVAGVTLGLVALGLLIIVLAVCCCRRRKKAEPVGVGDLVWGKQGVRAFWWPGEVTQGRNGNSLWVRWFGLNTFSPVSELKVQKFQSLEQHYDSDANETTQSYREALNRILEKKNSQRRDMYEMTLCNETVPSYSETVLDETTRPGDHVYQDVINEYQRLMAPPSQQIDGSAAEAHGYTNGAILENEGPYREMEVR